MLALLSLALTWIPSDSPVLSLTATPSAAIVGHPVVSSHPWSLGDAERYGSNWKALRADPEVASQWDTLPAIAQLELGMAFDSFRLRAILPLRRDLEAWATDPSGSNLPLGPSEIDINVPYEGWARWGSEHAGAIQIGRFRKSFSESPHGVILGGNLVHDAAWWRLPMGRWTFEWFASSLNPWLPGTAQDGSMEPGSEAQRQDTATVSNSRGRIYDEPCKTLFLHRLSVKLGDWNLAIVEQVMVGGKVPALRDALPVTIWHDNFGDGYSKISTALDFAWSPDTAARFHLQGILEDVRSPVGEVEGADPRAIFGVNAGWQGCWSGWGGTIRGSFDATATSPTLNNHGIPLLKGISRRLYRSNNQSQDQPGFADTWMVDQPLAYHRGPDAADLWSLWSWTENGGPWGASLEADFLQQGDATLWESADGLEDRVWPLSGIVEREARLSATVWREIFGWSVHGGLGASQTWNHDHKPGRECLVLSGFGGIARSF